MTDDSLDRKLRLDDSMAILAKQKIQNLDAFNFHWQKNSSLRPEKLLRELKELSTIASVGSSTRIEGSKLSNDEIKFLIKNLDINKLKSKDEEEVTGYYEVLNLVFDSYDAIQLHEAYIKQLHSLLLKYSSKDTRHKGEYKSLSNKVVATYPDGTTKVIFNTTEPYLTAKEMSDLVAWTNIKLKDSNYHPLLVIATFVYEFLSIHPFQDGNGRLSRVLSNLLLMRTGYEFVQYISLEHIIEDRKKHYYEYLMLGQQHRYSECENISLWVIFFLECLETLVEKLKIKLDSHIETSSPVINDRQSLILNFINEKHSARMSQLTKAFPEIPRITLSLDLKALVTNNLVQRFGRGRGVYYQAK